MRPRKENSPNGPGEIALQPGKHRATPETKNRVDEVAKKIAGGWTKFETTRWIMDTWGLNDSSANRYWNAALNQLAVNAEDDEYIKEMRKKTVATLDRLVQSEINEKRYKEANTSMELLSKLLGYNVNKIEAKVDTEIKFDFGGE